MSTLRDRLGAAYTALFDTAEKRASTGSPTKSIGGMGTVIYGGGISEDETDPSLVGARRYVTFHNLMLNTSIIAAGVRYYLNLVAKPTWKVEPIDREDVNESEAKAAAELIESCMYDMSTPWSRIVRKAALYRMHGFSIQEWTAKRRDDGQIGMLDVEPRPQHTIELWNVDESGTLQSVSQRIPQTNALVELPRGKIVYAVDDSLTDSPAGSGLLRHVVRPAHALRIYEQLEGYGFEGDLRGTPIGKAPFSFLQAAVNDGSMTQAEMDKLIEPIQNFMRQHYKTPQRALLTDSAVYRDNGESQSPSPAAMFSVDLLQHGSQTQQEIHTAIERLNREIARILGVEGLLLGNGQGSQALSRDKSHSFGLTVESALGELTEVFENDFAKPILRLNGLDEKLCPTFKTDAIQYRDIEQVTAALVDLATAGAPLLPGDPAIDEVRTLAGLSRVPDELVEVQLEAALTPPPPPPGQDPNNPDEEVEDPEEGNGDEDTTQAEDNAVDDPDEEGNGDSKTKPTKPVKKPPATRKPKPKPKEGEDKPPAKKRNTRTRKATKASK